MKNPSQGDASITCTCVLWHEGKHAYSQENPDGTCGVLTNGGGWCHCQWSLGAMMIAPDDPLRDTPEKAERYSRAVQRLQERLSEHNAAIAAEATDAVEREHRAHDIEAALRLLRSGLISQKRAREVVGA